MADMNTHLRRILVCCLCVAMSVAAAGQEQSALRIGVTPLQLAEPAEDEAAMRMNVAFPASEPDPEINIVPPQYRFSLNLPDQAPADDATVRFLIPLRQRLLLVQAVVTVDGKSFRKLREERVDTLLAQLPERVEQLRQAAEAKASPGAPGEVTPSGEEQGATDRDADQTPDESTAADLDPDAEPEADPEAESAAPFEVDNSVIARLARYALVTQRMPSRHEVTWLLEHWAAGPRLLLLNEGYQRSRSAQAPLWQILDSNHDGTISSEELEVAEQRLLSFDRNQDDVLTTDELLAAAEKSERSIPAVSSPVILLQQLTDPVVTDALRKRLGTAENAFSRIDLNQDQRIDDGELAALAVLPADLFVQIDFQTAAVGRSVLEVTSLSAELPVAETDVSTNRLRLLIDEFWLEFSAVQHADSMQLDQVSIGSVVDGFPLLPVVNEIDDARLTLRELRKVSQTLASFDRDGDGSISEAELVPTLRLCFGLGAIVHQSLANVRDIEHPETPEQPTPPGWFARMDQNTDFDLTIKEFLGTPEQFAELDEDADGLVSVSEALKAEAE